MATDDNMVASSFTDISDEMFDRAPAVPLEDVNIAVKLSLKATVAAT